MAIGSSGSMDPTVEKFKCDSNDAIHLKLVRSDKDVINDDNSFHPWMSHQVFGESETIFGYKGLKIKLYYHAGSLLTYLNMSCESKIPASYGIHPDAVLPKIAEVIPEGFVSNQEEFIRRLPKENEFVPMGDKINSYKTEEEDIEYEIYHADLNVPKLKDYHARLQTFILWYIDAASFIDADDEKWNYFMLFQKTKTPTSTEYSIVGYITVYHYFAYPSEVRPRISQMLILPTYQKIGHGVKLLQAVNNFYISYASAVDISVEDPSEEFVRIRDYIDCKNCQKLDEFKKEHLLTGFSDDMKKAALTSFKINKRQVRRVYEILRLQCVDVKNESMYREYRLDVKNRLNIPYQKQARDMKKLQNALSPEEYNAAMVGQTFDERVQRLDDAFQQLVDDYKRVLDRMAQD